MSALDDRRRLNELYLPPVDDFAVVDVPELQFAMLDGAGDHESEVFTRATRWLVSAIAPIKLIARQRMGRRFVEAPLECLWWADDMAAFAAGDRAEFRWRQMIVTADWVDPQMFENGVATASERLGEPPKDLRLERFAEGTCVQIMHVGPENEEAWALMTRLHDEYLPAHGLVAAGPHHEIYLSDPARVRAEKLRTVLRQPVVVAPDPRLGGS
jgi:hypothetical protein